jgi:hypothetical protein
VPISIESAVARAAPQLSINSNSLCNNTAYVGTPTHPFQLTQAASGSSANIIVDVTWDTTANKLTAVTVTVSLSASGLAWPLSAAYPLTAQSTDPVILFTK